MLDDQVRKFMESRVDRTWLRYDNDSFRVYVRKAMHSYKGKGYYTFDVASIEVAESRRGQGIFTRWLDSLETNIDRPVFVESVTNKRLHNFLKKRGYDLVTDCEGFSTESYIKLVEDPEELAFNLLRELVTRARNNMEYKHKLPEFKRLLDRAPQLKRVIARALESNDITRE